MTADINAQTAVARTKAVMALRPAGLGLIAPRLWLDTWVAGSWSGHAPSRASLARSGA